MLRDRLSRVVPAQLLLAAWSCMGKRLGAPLGVPADPQVVDAVLGQQ